MVRGINKQLANEIEFDCTIQNQRYYSEETSFGVYVFTTKDEIPEFIEVKEDLFNDEQTLKQSTLAGNMQFLHIGNEYHVKAILDYNKKYNSYQYKPQVITATVPKSEEQQKKFLESIITPRQANTLIEKYPNIVEDIVNGNDKVDIEQLKGIGQRTYNLIKEKVLENYVISDILVLLQPLGITYNTIKKLLTEEPNPVLLKQKLLENPYIMTKLRGFGFKRVDGLALKLNPDLKVSKQRTMAFLNYHFIEIGNSFGHTWITLNALENSVRDNINECMSIYENIIQTEKKYPLFFHIDGERIGLKEYFDKEIDTLNILKEIDKKYKVLEIKDENIENGIAKAEKEQGFKLTEEQREVSIEATKNNLSLISGKAGTGKSTILRTLLSIYSDAKYTIACCALSAKAAQRITEATGFPASTIHRLLKTEHDGSFMYNHDNPLPYDVVVLDEGSMVNTSLFYAVVSAVKEGAKLIVCGDNMQLPPIGYGNVFSDLIQMTSIFHSMKLTKVLRQAEKSGILLDANKIREGIMPIDKPELKIVTGELRDMIYMFRDSREAIFDNVIKLYMSAIESDGLDEVVIISPRKESCQNSALEFNLKINEMIVRDKSTFIKYGKKTYYVGSKVMQVDNNYDKNVFNGEVGYITEIKEDKEKNTTIFKVEYRSGDDKKLIEYTRNEINQIDYAYALTVHKCQGSGYKTAIITIDLTHYTLLDTCILYTAITRAKKRCALLSEPKAFKICMGNNKSLKRQTWLGLL